MVLALMEILAASLIVAMATQITAFDKETNTLPFLAVACLIVFVVKGGVTLLDSYVQNSWIQSLILNFKKRLVTRYTEMDYAYQITLNSGRSLSVLYNDADIYMRIGLTSAGIMLSEISVFLILIAYLLYLQPAITAVLLIMFLIMGGFLFYILFPLLESGVRQFRKLRRLATKKRYKFYSLIRIF